MQIRSSIRDILLRTETGYRAYLKYKWKLSGAPALPAAPWRNAVLKKNREVDDAVRQVKDIGLFPHIDKVKNWDSLAALDCILKNTDKNARILDAGAELYSVILPWLVLYGYKNLTGINLIFEKPARRGPIVYEYGDITKTDFEQNRFDAITCLSVIEHGVDPAAYLNEMSRILKPGGMLISSIDYFSDPIDTKNAVSYGARVHIFSKTEVVAILRTAEECNFEPTGPLNLDCQEKVVSWGEHGLDYTFLIFTLRKKI